LLSLFGAALTLPGIAAVVLTVGMAVDANILIYERIREELRNGVSPRAAITAGFDRAFSAIADSNVTALIAGLVLWLFGAGAVRGFAVVLVLGIATSMFTSLMGSRAGAAHLRRQAQGRPSVDLREASPRNNHGIFSQGNALPVHEHPQGVVRAVGGLDRRLRSAGGGARLESGRRLHRRRGGRDEFPAGAEHRQLRGGARQGGAWGMRRCRPSAARATSWCACRPTRTPRAIRSARTSSRCSAASIPGVKLQSTEVVGPQVGQELFVKGGWALVATLVLIADLRAVALHVQAGHGRDPRRAARSDLRARLLRPDPDDLRPDGDLGHSGGDRLFLERHRDRVRPRARARAHRAQAHHRAGHRRVHQPDAVAYLDDQAGDACWWSSRC
jgi:hypothetical protein